ncbi:MAG: DUF1003 domain-containing protein [Desulfobulbaceae bacterium]|nr:DUF1003 domain-containing protein [Desulfobulbaceae bacterium]
MENSADRFCQICGRKATETDLLRASMLRPVVVEVIRKSFSAWSDEGFICLDDMKRFRTEYVSSLIAAEKGELSELEREVVDSLAKHEIISSHVDEEFDSMLTFGQRLSDLIARFGGSWSFIIIFFCIMVMWMAVNSYLMSAKPFDPFPYILLNLVLSCLAAIQAPIIMMSQNRVEAKDRLRAAHDYQVNLKAELEIRQLHQKLDHLLSRQWERLVEIQEVQLELLNEMHSQQKGQKNEHGQQQ